VSPELRWRIVLARDRRYDGAFVYAVRSTGIYCRPSCASRRPGRSQVTFFPIPEAAEREGFRACRRCRPTERSEGHGDRADDQRRSEHGPGIAARGPSQT